MTFHFRFTFGGCIIDDGSSYDRKSHCLISISGNAGSEGIGGRVTSILGCFLKCKNGSMFSSSSSYSLISFIGSA